MKTPSRVQFAFCMTSLIMLLMSSVVAADVPTGDQTSDYKMIQLYLGAKRLTLLSQLEYRRAHQRIKEGDVAAAEIHLHEALRLNPDYPDAYFTLAKLKLQQFSPEMLFYIYKGFYSIARDFRYQSLLAANGILYTLLLLLMLTIIISVALALRYFPFVAHTIREFLENRLHASRAGLIAYLILLLPIVLYPGIITWFAIVTVLTWFFLSKKEKAIVLFVAALIFLMGIFPSYINRLSPAANPKSLSSLIARANTAPGDYSLIRTIEETPAGDLEAEKHLCLGLLYLRNENFIPAGDHLLRALKLRADSPMAYINIGNVYYLQGEFAKALEGYQKAVAINDNSAIGNFNLAQAYIKALLLAESSIALRKASALGITSEKEGYAKDALKFIKVYPATFSNSELWNIMMKEGSSANESFYLGITAPLMKFSPRTSAWIILGALLVAMLLSGFIKPSQLAFRCGNCGAITCNHCCNDNQGINLCQRCADTIEGISSEKVFEALLRQQRQVRIAKHMKSSKLLAIAIPGVKHIYYDRFFKGCMVGLIFSFFVIQFFSKGFIIKNWESVPIDTPLWKTLLPIAAILYAIAVNVFSKNTVNLKGMMNKKSEFEKKKYAIGKEKLRKAASL